MSTNNILALPATIDEQVKFPSLPSSFEASVVLDGEQNKFINSLGIRELMNYLKLIPSEVVIEFQSCRPALVRTMNMVAGILRANSVVNSFYVPLVCESCDNEVEIKLNNKIDYEFKVKAPEVKGQNCESCKEEMCLSVMPATYFKFISS